MANRVTAIQNDVQARGYATDTSAPQILIVNSVHKEVQQLRRWDWRQKRDTSLSTTAGTASVTITGITDLVPSEIDAARLTIGTESYDLLAQPNPQEILDDIAADAALSITGTPLYWTTHHGLLYFWPIPDRVYTIALDYIKAITAITAGTDDPDSPAEWDDVYTYLTLRELAARERDWTAADRWGARADVILDRMKRRHDVKQRQNATHSKPRASGLLRRPRWLRG